jgi:ATP-dependent Clp protease ATP-binding subunit ClpC
VSHPQLSQATEIDLAQLCKDAEDIAQRRGERIASVHLLISISSRAGAATSVLDSFRVTQQKLEVLALAVPDGDTEPPRGFVQQAREISSRFKAEETTGIHLLLALLNDRTCWAYRTIEKCGADVAKLRAASIQIATGARIPQRIQRHQPSHGPRATQPAVPTQPRAQAVPFRLGNNKPIPSNKPIPQVLPTTVPSPAQPVAVMPTVKVSPTAKAVPHHRSPKKANVPPAAVTKQVPQRFHLESDKFPLLTSLGKNLTRQAYEGGAGPVVGRDSEVQRALDVLAKRQANSPILIGVPGVGKSTTVRAIAQTMAKSEPNSADDRILIELGLAELLAGTGVRGALAERFATLRSEIQASQGNVVLVFEDIHQLFSGDVSAEIGSELRTSLAQGELPCIGTSSPDEFRRMVENEAAIMRCFTSIIVEEPNEEETVRILNTVVESYERHHHTRFDEPTLRAGIRWTSRYLPGRALPEKAMSVLDLAGARSRRRGLKQVTMETLAQVVSELTDVPVERMLESDHERMLALEQTMAKGVVGHQDALARIAAVLRRNAAGLRGRRPIGTFLLLGPTGVGKTETAKAVARALFDSPDAMTRVDLSEYSEAHSIARLIGAPPGYVGHEAGGQLTEAVRKRPYQVILLDEIEKAHRDVLEGFLQVFDEGRMTDGRGRTVDFTHAVIVLTSNLGSSVAVQTQEQRGIGFGVRNSTITANKPAVDREAVIMAARAELPPELFNRFDEVLVYAPLNREEVRTIARNLIDQLSRSLESERGISLDVSEEIYELLLERGGYDPQLGARPMKRTVASLIEVPLADLLLRNQLTPGDCLRIDRNGDEGIQLTRRRGGARVRKTKPSSDQDFRE